MLCSAESVECKLSPDVQGSGSFTMSGTLQSQSGGGGLLTVQLDFAPMSLGAVNIACSVLGARLNYPLAQDLVWDPNQMGLGSLQFPSTGGTVPFSYAKMSWTVTVTRVTP